MKEYDIEDLKKENLENREMAISAVKRVGSDFYLGKRELDRPRRTEGKQEVLDRLRRGRKRNESRKKYR